MSAKWIIAHETGGAESFARDPGMRSAAESGKVRLSRFFRLFTGGLLVRIQLEVVPIEQIPTVSFAAMYTGRGYMLDWRELSG